VVVDDREGQLDPKWGTPSPGHDPYVLANFRARPTDVLITTAPKAGTTWMQQILHQLRTGGDPDFECIYDVVPWLELRDKTRGYREVLDRFEALGDPRVFKTHCTFQQTPGVDTAKIVLSSRDPRDCFVSMYHHLNDMTEEALAEWGGKAPPSLDAAFERWIGFGAWYRNVSSWWAERHRPNILWLRYQDMKADFPGTVDRIIAHLGWDVTPAGRARAIAYSSFEWMAAHREKFIRHTAGGMVNFKPGGFIRGGRVGDHQGTISPEQERAILDKARATLTSECIAFLELPC
jgi:hypothetical protein